MDGAAALSSAAEGELGAMATDAGCVALLRCVEPRCVVLCAEYAECVNDECTPWIQCGISVGFRPYVTRP